MYNLRDIFKKLEGRDFTGPELEKELGSILLQYIGEIPIEIQAVDLFDKACKKGWVKETDDGKLQFHVVEDCLCVKGYTTAPDGFVGVPCPFWTSKDGEKK